MVSILQSYRTKSHNELSKSNGFFLTSHTALSSSDAIQTNAQWVVGSFINFAPSLNSVYRRRFCWLATLFQTGPRVTLKFRVWSSESKASSCSGWKRSSSVSHPVSLLVSSLDHFCIAFRIAPGSSKLIEDPIRFSDCIGAWRISKCFHWSFPLIENPPVVTALWWSGWCLVASSNSRTNANRTAVWTRVLRWNHSDVSSLMESNCQPLPICQSGKVFIQGDSFPFDFPCSRLKCRFRTISYGTIPPLA